MEYIVETTPPSDDERKKFANLSQDTKEFWLARSQFMVTASEFGAAIGVSPHISRGKFIIQKREGIIPKVDDFQQKAMDWGKEHERDGLICFKNWQPKLKVERTGIWIHPYDDRIAGSPDGIVYNSEDIPSAVLEIKCPFTKLVYKNMYDFKGDCPQKECIIPHHHYIQVQGQMMCVGVRKAYYVVWTPTCYAVAIVHFDENLWINTIYPHLIQTLSWLSQESTENIPERFNSKASLLMKIVDSQVKCTTLMVVKKKVAIINNDDITELFWMTNSSVLKQ